MKFQSVAMPSTLRGCSRAVSQMGIGQLLVRRKQLLAEAHVANPNAPTYEAADYFMGSRYRPGGGIVVPALTQQVAHQIIKNPKL